MVVAHAISPATSLSEATYFALEILIEAQKEATDLSCPVWQFACELGYLREAGASITALRSLVLRGFAEHAIETTRPCMKQRTFRQVDNLAFDGKSCFVLTKSGFQAVCNATPTDHGSHQRISRSESGLTTVASVRPSFVYCNDGHRELRVNESIVKRFRTTATCQELILASFEELGWPCHADDPLPIVKNLDPKKRLHDAIARLNRNQLVQLIRFHGDGNGRGVYWEFTALIDNNSSKVRHAATARQQRAVIQIIERPPGSV